MAAKLQRVSHLFRCPTKEVAMFVSSIIAAKGGNVISVLAQDSIADLLARLAEYRVGAVLVRGHDGGMVGIVSERDIVRALAREGAATLNRRVAEVMISEVETCDPDDTIDHIMTVMTERRIRHLPVMRAGQLVGMISIGDVVKNLIDETRHEAEALKQYIAAH